MNRTDHKYKAFTLVEVLVVILIIGVLIAILVPAVSLLRASFLDSSTENILKTTQHIMDESIILNDNRVQRMWNWNEGKIDGINTDFAVEHYHKYGSGGGAYGPMPFKYRGRIIDVSLSGKGQFYSSSGLLYVAGLDNIASKAGGSSASNFKGQTELTSYVKVLQDSKAIQYVGRNFEGYNSNVGIVDSRGYPIQVNYWITHANSIFPMSDASYAASPGRDGQWGDATQIDDETTYDEGKNGQTVWPWYPEVNSGSSKYVGDLFIRKSIEHYYNDFSEEATSDNQYSLGNLKK